MKRYFIILKVILAIVISIAEIIAFYIIKDKYPNEATMISSMAVGYMFTHLTFKSVVLEE